MVSDQTLEGLGTTSSFLIQALFGALVRLAGPGQQLYSPNTALPGRPISSVPSTPPILSTEPTQLSPSDIRETQSATMATNIVPDPLASEQLVIDGLDSSLSPADALAQADLRDHDNLQAAFQADQDTRVMTKSKLTDLLPEPGYFLAGAVSGAVSRTATAPLDRLKVALLVRTGSDSPLEALKAGQKPVRPIAAAVRSLWRTGGLRTFFAGTTRVPNSSQEFNWNPH